MTRPFAHGGRVGSSCLLLVGALLVVASLGAFGRQVWAAEPAWEADIRAFEQQDAKTPPPKQPILFVGSSSIRLWDLAKSFPGLPMLNRGFGGSQTADVVRYADRIVLKYEPRTIVFYSGDNDIASGKSAEHVAADFDELYKLVRAKLPKTQIIFLPTKPSILRWALVDKMRAANEAIRSAHADDPLFVYADTASPLLGSDGKPRAELFQLDGLHLNPRGYDLWTEVVKPLLEPAGDSKTPR